MSQKRQKDGKSTRKQVKDVYKRQEWGERFGQVFKTITVDNGSEFADWEGMQQSATDESEKRVTVFYCHPYCSFERGSNENQNRLVRRKIPKEMCIRDRHKTINVLHKTRFSVLVTC